MTKDSPEPDSGRLPENVDSDKESDYFDGGLPERYVLAAAIKIANNFKFPI